jgi:hypothetical protein
MKISLLFVAGVGLALYMFMYCYFSCICNFSKVHFTIVIMPNFLGTNHTSLELFWQYFWLFFAESCFLAILSVESDRGQRKTLLPPGSELQISNEK